MIRKIVWVLVSCLMVLSLVLASCAPAVVEEEEAPPVVPVVEEKKPVVEEKPAVPEKEMVRDTLGRLVEKPQYGGALVYVFYKSQAGWDAACTRSVLYRQNLVLENLIMGDWTKGPSGTGEVSWEVTRPEMLEDVKYGLIAESWEYPDPVTAIYHIRKGIRWHNKPPTNGRELTADDVVVSINYYFSVPTSYIRGVLEKAPTSVKVLDRYTVEIKWPDSVAALYGNLYIEESCKILPADALEEYGHMHDWHHVIGTGAFTVEDEVAGTSTLLVRNPDFWEKDPMHPDLDLQLPYVDKIKWVIIYDKSTRMAAIRTGKGSMCREFSWEDAGSMKMTRPDLQYHRYMYSVPYALPLRQNDPTLPWADKRVRHALWLAMDHKTMKDEFYGGNADLNANPILPLPDYKDFYVPLEELPKSTQELYEYHPDKAKQLMVEAGYPDGFDFEVVCRAEDVDMLSMVKDMWTDINVNLILDVREYGVWSSIIGGRTYKDSAVIWTRTNGIIDFCNARNPHLTGRDNVSFVDDPKMNENREQIEAAGLAGDNAEVGRLIKEITPYIQDQAWQVSPPNVHFFYIAQPWVKHWSGEYSVGFRQYFGHLKYLWIDQELKKEMGY